MVKSTENIKVSKINSNFPNCNGNCHYSIHNRTHIAICGRRSTLDSEEKK